MKRKGFSLIEVCVAVALVGVMVGISGPKIKRYIANGKNTKAIANLNVIRTASQLYYSETGDKTHEKNEDIRDSLKKLKDYLDIKTYESIKEGKLEIGGGKTSDKLDSKTYYGGKADLTFENPNSEEENDGVYIWLKPEEGKQYDLKGKKWSEY